MKVFTCGLIFTWQQGIQTCNRALSSKTLMINCCWNCFGAVLKVPSMNQMSLSHTHLRPLKVANTMSLFELSSPSWKLSYIKNGMLSAPPIVIYSVCNSGVLLRESGSSGVFPRLIHLTACLIVGILPTATLTPTGYLASLSCTIWLGSPRFAATESFNSCLTFRAWTWKWSASWLWRVVNLISVTWN